MLKGILGALSLRSKNPSTSQMFLSLNVEDTMRTPGLSRQITREIIRLSIGSLIFIGVTFLIVYTILLAYVDNKLRPYPEDGRYWNYRRVKFVGKKIKNPTYFYEGSLHFDKGDGKRVWNSSQLYVDAVLPKCQTQSLFRVVITSSPINSQRRKQIRDTWCNPQNFNASAESWQCVFLISHSTNDYFNKMVRQESETFQDILHGSYVDSYRNLTLKVIHGLDWTASHCPSSFLVKTDDDCFVNSGLMHSFLLNHNTIAKGLYAGNFVMEKERRKVIRDQDTKWSVSLEDFPDDFYPPYASGIGYVLSLDTLKQFVSQVPFIKPIVNEDAFVGIVMSHIGIRPTDSSRFILSATGLNVCNFLYVMIAHDVTADKQVEVMEKAVKSRTECKNREVVHSWS